MRLNMVYIIKTKNKQTTKRNAAIVCFGQQQKNLCCASTKKVWQSF